ncbi:MAG: protein adenylyltransferase SelO [Pontiellaceae bacterium]
MKSYGFNFDTTYTLLPKVFHSELNPEVVSDPNITIFNESLAESLGLNFSILSYKEQSELLSGSKLVYGSKPFSQSYAGHQFGHFTMLGDGRAHILGEHVTESDERFDIQLKGSGRTPYSRRGDGKAALGPMLREFIISEAMHYLGIPTTRSLAVVSTGESIRRETILPGAILTRVASSHIRIGTFEFAASYEDKNIIQSLLDYSVQRHYPEILDSENKPLALIKVVMEKQVDLIVHWMRVGFIHGVMNTDNMVLSGETIDYGPCAFMDQYDPNTVFSSIDHGGRYAYGSQPKIAQWNLARLAETLLPLINEDIDKAIKLAEEVIHQFSDMYQNKWQKMMQSKLGLIKTEKVDIKLISDLLDWMQKSKADFTNTFSDLTSQKEVEDKIYNDDEFQHWFNRWKKRINNNPDSQLLMRENNPVFIPRNHNVENALSAAENGDINIFNNLLEVLRSPYKNNDLIKHYQAPPKPNERVYQTFCGT